MDDEKNIIRITKKQIIIILILTIVFLFVRPVLLNWLVTYVCSVFDYDLRFTYWQMFIISIITDIVKSIITGDGVSIKFREDE